MPGNDHKYRDWKEWGHGIVTMDKALLSQSIPTLLHGEQAWNRSDVGRNEVVWFGRRQGRDIQDDSPGILPSRAWKREARNQSWYQGETVISGIGQGFG